jgi:lipopolysaccharide export system permease protein
MQRAANAGCQRKRAGTWVEGARERRTASVDLTPPDDQERQPPAGDGGRHNAAMRAARLERYLLRETAFSWLGVTLVLLAIMLATRFARFLGQAAQGRLPEELLFQVAGLSSLQYLIILTPISLLLAVMIALGRLYRDQEVTAMLACGAPLSVLYRPCLWLAAGVALLTALLAFELGPWAGRTADALVADAARANRYNPFEAGRFKSVPAAGAVLYTGRLSDDGHDIEQFFGVQVDDRGQESVLVAEYGRSDADPVTGERILSLSQGHRYAGSPGTGDFEIIGFDRLTTRIAPPQFSELSGKRKLASTESLWQSRSSEDLAELNFRLAVPVSVLVLVLLAVPLSHVKPRSGRYGRLVIGVVLYLVYSQLITLGQVWIAKGQVPPEIGIWWVHLLFAGLAGVMILRQSGRLR